MTPRRISFIREHAQAGRHVTGAMALELLAHVERLRNALEVYGRHVSPCPKALGAMSRKENGIPADAPCSCGLDATKSGEAE